VTDTSRTTIPLSMLQGGCAAQLEIVKREWPDGIPLTEESCERAVALKLDVSWLASRLLTKSGWSRYVRDTSEARAYCHLVTSTAWDRFFRHTAAARSDYRRGCAMKELIRVTGPETEIYKCVVSPAWAEFARVSSTTLLGVLTEEDGEWKSSEDEK
jgi:hypothetical protein